MKHLHQIPLTQQVSNSTDMNIIVWRTGTGERLSTISAVRDMPRMGPWRNILGWPVAGVPWWQRIHRIPAFAVLHCIERKQEERYGFSQWPVWLYIKWSHKHHAVGQSYAFAKFRYLHFFFLLFSVRDLERQLCPEWHQRGVPKLLPVRPGLSMAWAFESSGPCERCTVSGEPSGNVIAVGDDDGMVNLYSDTWHVTIIAVTPWHLWPVKSVERQGFLHPSLAPKAKSRSLEGRLLSLSLLYVMIFAHMGHWDIWYHDIMYPSSWC